MPTTSTPGWSGAQSGLVGNAAAVAGSAQINQFLGTHADDLIYQGNRILLPEFMYSPAQNPWNAPLINMDVDQPFTMSGTAIGRIQLPILPVGNGADLLVSLCADNSGTPGTMITQTRVPASWITQLACQSAPSGPASAFPTLQLTGNPLAVPQIQAWGFADQVVKAYNYPAITFVGSSANPSATFYDGYIVIIGGVSNSAALTGVYTMQYDGSGVLHPTLPQPVFPNPNDGSSASCVVLDSSTGNPVVVNTGGGTAYLGPAVANVFTASLNAVAGTLSSWSVQTSLPAAVQSHVMASWNGYVYSVGGKGSGGVVNTVNYAQVQNGQITSWTATTPLPVATQLAFVAATNGCLVVAGGCDLSLTPFSAVYYAVINANGSLGPWISGPPLHTATYNLNSNAYGNSQGVVMATNINALVFGTSGPAWTWDQDLAGGGGVLPGYFDFGTGQVMVYALAPSGNQYGSVFLNLTPYLSVPLPATGLTNGSTYHVLLQQQGGNQANYLFTSITANTYSVSGPTALTSNPSAYSWTAQPTGNGVAIQAFDQTVPYQGAFPVHSWEDSGARVTTFVCATTPDLRLLGLCEATRIQTQRNQNAGFESGIPPWTVAGGTAAQSSTEVFEGQFAAQVTPNGTSATVTLTSEQTLPCLPGQAITVAGQFWFTNAVTSANFSLSIAWFTQTGTPVSTTNMFTTMPAGAYTPVTNTLTAPAGAYQYAIQPTLQGTPSSAQVWYADQVYSTDLMTPQQSSVTECEYPAAWPALTWPLLSTDVLA